MDKIKSQLAGVAALLGVIAAIGGGFVKYGEITTKLDALASQESADYSAQIAVLEEKVAALENADTTHSHDFDHTHDNTAVKVVEKEIELLKIQIEEIKVKSSNPLAN
jgi:hypothetical protein|tara:strand:+ start:224 stop:547 length:324 start_codon:yes stop_codon:yes gene_type:complete